MDAPSVMHPLPMSSHLRLMTRLKTRHLQLLAAIDRLGSLSRAAREAQVSQPAATKTLAELEAIFEAPLFLRTGGRLVATDLGRLATGRALRMLQDFENWACEMQAVRAGHTATLRVGAVPYVSGELLGRTASCLFKDHGISLTLVRATSDQLTTSLAKHELDCVIGRAVPGALAEGFTHELLFPQKPALIAHPTLATRLGRRSPDWKALAQLNWILPSPATPIGAVVLELFARAQARPPTPVIETYSLDVITGMLRNDPTLISIIPENLARELVRGGEIGIVDWRLDWSLPPMTLIRRKQEPARWAEDQLALVLHALCATS